MIGLFHGICLSRREATSGVCDPQQGITTAFVGEFVESLLDHGVAIRELKDVPGRRHAEWFGPRALMRVSDCDRPFSPAELMAFARSPYVFLGNHTGDHAILVNYESQGIRDQIEDAQRFLIGISGGKSIAYPNGNYDLRVLEIVRSVGLQFGLTVWGAPAGAPQGRVLGAMAGVGARHRKAGVPSPAPAQRGAGR